MRKITVEEIDILVQANIEGALKEFQKLVPEIRKQIKQITAEFNKANIKDITAKIDMSQVKSEAQKMGKQIKEAFDPNITNFTINGKKAISGISNEFNKLTGKKLDLGNAIELNSYKNSLNTITSSANKAKKTVESIGYVKYDTNSIDNYIKKFQQLEKGSLKSKMSSIKNNNFTMGKQEIAPNQNSLSLWDTLRVKIQQIKSTIQQIKPEIDKTFKENKDNTFTKMVSNIKEITPKLSGVSSITQKIKTQIKQWGTSFKSGLGHILKYAGALFSIRGIYNILSSSAQSWLSSQNAGAKQLSANIEYMKNAMGSALAPVIQFITNLVYQLMKAIQSVAYAFTGVNIFAKATASSMNNVAGSAKKANKEAKQLAGIHNEINNVQTQDNSDSSGSGAISPSMDLSKMENTPNTILDAIKNGNWEEIGRIIGEKLNNALASIPWDKIQNTAKSIATNIAQFLNGFIESTDWNLVGSTIGNGINTAFMFANTLLTTIDWGNIGNSIANFLNSSISTINWFLIGNTFSNGLNSIIYFGYNFVTSFDWKQFGKAIGDSINGFFKNVDWKTAGETLGEGIKGIFDSISSFFQTFDWSTIIDGLIDFLTNIDWSGVVSSIFEALGSACASFVNLGMIIGEYINQAFDNIGQYFQDEIEECGGNIVLGILKGIGDAIIGIGQWIYDNILKPFADGFCKAFGIHSPSTVFADFGKNIIQGLFEGIQSLVDKIKEIWNNIKQNAINIFNEIKEKIVNVVNTIKDKVTTIFTNVKDTITNIFNNIKSTITNIWDKIVSTISNVWNTIVTKVKEGVSGAWNAITSVFGNISNWFKDKFSQAWQAVKNVFSTGGKIFDGIKDGILSGLKSIVNAIINGINKVISIPFNGINSALKSIKKVNIMGIQPFNWINTIRVPQIPTLAKGGVLYEETAFIGGEYQGASNNPEIVTPQNIMEDTFDKVMSKYSNSNDKPIYLTVNVSNKKIGQILLDNLRDMKRQTGKGIEVLVGG